MLVQEVLVFNQMQQKVLVSDHANAQGGYSLTFNTGRSMPIFGVRSLTLNQYLGSVNNNTDKIQYLGSRNLKKGNSCILVQFITVVHSINVVLHWGHRNK